MYFVNGILIFRVSDCYFIYKYYFFVYQVFKGENQITDKYVGVYKIFVDCVDEFVKLLMNNQNLKLNFIFL